MQLKPFDPESKGIVERANRFMETSFLPRHRFRDPLDFNAQLEEWLQLANRRTVRSLEARPCDLLSLDRGHMLELPSAAPSVGFRQRVRIGQDYYARVLGNDYSIDPSASKAAELASTSGQASCPPPGRPLRRLCARTLPTLTNRRRRSAVPRSG